LRNLRAKKNGSHSGSLDFLKQITNYDINIPVKKKAMYKSIDSSRKSRDQDFNIIIYIYISHNKHLYLNKNKSIACRKN